MERYIRVVALPVLSPVITTRMLHLPAPVSVSVVASVHKGQLNMEMGVCPNQSALVRLEHENTSIWLCGKVNIE